MPHGPEVFMLSRLGLLCAVLLPALALSQSVSSPILLPGDAVVAPAAGRQETPQIARGVDGYLAVWADNRSSLGDAGISTGPFGGGLGTMFDIYATRLNLNGAVIDANPIVISNGQYNQTAPRVAWNGQNWLVAWATEGDETSRYTSRVMVARVSPAGVVLDNPPIIVDSGGSSLLSPWSVVSDGSNWMVTWRDSADGTWVIEGARISPAGLVLDPGGKHLRRDVWNSGTTNSDIAFAGDEYLLVFEEWGTEGWVINAQRLSLALDPLGSVFRLNTYSPTDAHRPAVASNGTDFLVVWFEDKWYGWAQIYGTRVSHTGTVLDANGLPITDFAGYTQFEPDLGWDGSNYIVAHNRDYDIYTTRVTSAGAVLDPAGIPVKISTETKIQPAIAAGPSGGGTLVWTTSFNADIFAATVASNGTAGEDRVITLSVPRQSTPRLATSGDEFLVVFRSEISGEIRIVAQRLDSAGTPLTQEPILVAAGATLRTPSVAWNGLHYYIVWENAAVGRGQVYGRRMTKDGTFLDASPRAVMVGRQPDVAALGTIFLIVDTDAPNPQFRFTQSIRVDTDGTILGSPLRLGAYFDVAPRVAAVGSRWLVVWEQNVTHDNPWSQIVGRFVNPDGSADSSFNISDGGHDDMPHLSAGVDTTLIVWEENDIYGRRIRSDGTMFDSAGGIVISNAPEPQFAPAVAWEGIRWVTDFVDHRSEAYPNQPRGDIFGTRVDLNGIVMDQGGFAISNSDFAEDTPGVAAMNGSVLFAYSTFTTPQATMRLALRRMNAAPAPPPPGAPGNLVATPASSSQINLTWSDNSSSENGFRIERCTGSGCAGFVQIVQTSANASSFSDKGLSASTLYNYRIRSFNEGGNSEYSNTAGATTFPPPVAPSNLAGNSVSGCRIDLTWSDNSADESGFKIERCTGSECSNFTQIGQVGSNVTTYSSNELTTSTRYTYRVRAFNDGGNSDFSNTAEGTTLAAPTAPSNLVATGALNRIDVTWSDNSNTEDSFHLYRCAGSATFCDSSSGYWIYWSELAANTTTYIDNFADPGVTFSYKVSAFRCGGGSAFSNTDDATPPAPQPPAAPSNLTARAGATGKANSKAVHVDLKWQDNSDFETSFRLERCTGEACTNFSVLVITTANVTIWRDSTAQRRTWYRYRVIAAAGPTHSAPSNVVAVKTD